MAKHPHRLIFMHKKTWRCTLPGCNFFVHQGLTHVLLGKTAICWECADQFVIDEHALTEEQPRCPSCRGVAELQILFNPPSRTESVSEADQVEVTEPTVMWVCNNPRCGEIMYEDSTNCTKCGAQR